MQIRTGKQLLSKGLSQSKYNTLCTNSFTQSVIYYITFAVMETAHIYIYGEIGYWQSSDAADWGEVTLTGVREQYEAQKDCEEITLHIHSPGGYVTEGFAIHDYIRSLGKPVTTIVEGMCYSIATVIALAGDKRLMTSNSDFMIHNPWGGAWGESSEIQKYADDLKELEVKVANFYAAKTNITSDEALELMKAETFMTPEKALEKGFITEIATVMKAVAMFNPNTNKMSKKKMTQKEAESALDKALNAIKSLFPGGGKAQNKIVQDANGTEIDFTELEEDATPSVGDKATVDGSPADGEHVMPNGETYVFASGELSEIKEAEEEEEEDTSEEMQALQEEVDALNKKLSKEQDAVKKLKSENKKLSKQLSDQEEILEDVKEQILNVKKSIGSEFKHEEGNRNHKNQNGNQPTRKVWKESEE